MKKAVKTWSTPFTQEECQAVPCAVCGQSRFKPAFDCGDFKYVGCLECGLIQQNPQPGQEAVAARYRDRHGQDYLQYELANEGNFLRLQELALADIGFDYDRKGRALDVGCATGALLAHLRSQGWTVAGVELCHQSAEYAQKERALDVRPTTLEEAAFNDASFDLIHASHLIEHLNDPASFIRTVYRLLSPSGELLLSTPNSAGFQARLFGAAWRSAIFDHLYLFSIKTLSRLLQQEGFTVTRIVTWGGLAAGTAPQPLKKLADRLVKPLGAGDVMMLRAVKM